MEDQESAVATLRKKLGLADYATVENCMAALIESYALEDYAPAEQRRLAGIQYEMAIRDFSLKNPFVFCNDISRDTACLLYTSGFVDFLSMKIDSDAGPSSRPYKKGCGPGAWVAIKSYILSHLYNVTKRHGRSGHRTALMSLIHI